MSKVLTTSPVGDVLVWLYREQAGTEVFQWVAARIGGEESPPMPLEQRNRALLTDYSVLEAIEAGLAKDTEATQAIFAAFLGKHPGVASHLN